MYVSQSQALDTIELIYYIVYLERFDFEPA